MTVLEIWDFISDTNDEKPCDRAFSRSVLDVLAANGAPQHSRILDLGGGAGNPSIDLALHGHEVVLVDVDPAFIGAATRRAKLSGATLKTVRANWTDYLSSQQVSDATFDAILFLGNSLAYQDSWPDLPLPTEPVPDPLLPTLRLCRGLLAPNGLVVIESSF